MIGRKSILVFAAAVVLLYGASPYVALWRLLAAIHAGDERALASAVDWNAVRSGLKQDVAEGLMGDLAGEADGPRVQLASHEGATAASDAGREDSLPPFGASFINGIAGSVIERDVTPEHLAGVIRDMLPGEAESQSALPLAGIRGAFFSGLASFELRVLCPGQDAADQPLRVRLELRSRGWMIVRAWVPQDLVDMANART